MHARHLQTRFILSGCLLVAVTLASGLWSALTFAHLSTAADSALAEAREKIDLTAELAGCLEREDDALLLALSGDARRARTALTDERQRGDRCFHRLHAVLAGDPAGEAASHTLEEKMARYREAGSRLTAGARQSDALERYHRLVNPLLRQAVADCGKIREGTFEALRRAGLSARDEAARARRVVASASVAALLLVIAVSAWLARSVLRPVRALSESVEAVRRGDFDHRVSATSNDELGQLAAGFNRMAETLAEYRASSLGELLAAKATLEATLNALPDAVIVIAPDGRLAALNPAPGPSCKRGTSGRPAPWPNWRCAPSTARPSRPPWRAGRPPPSGPTSRWPWTPCSMAGHVASCSRWRRFPSSRRGGAARSSFWMT